MPLELLVDVVNEWGSEPRRAAGEAHLPFPPIRDLIAAYSWSAPRGWRPALTDEHLVRVADSLFPFFAAERPTTAARRLNALIDDLAPRPRLEAADGGFRPALAVERPEDALLAASVAVLAAFLTQREQPRFGVCTGSRCVDVFVDLSPSRRRRFCSLTCQNRSRVAAFRARHAATGGGRAAPSRQSQITASSRGRGR